MRGTERFRRMKELEDRVTDLVDNGWRAERVAYEDEEGEPFRAFVTLRLDDRPDEDGVL